MMQRVRQRSRGNALERLESLFGTSPSMAFEPLDDVPPSIEDQVYDPELQDAMGAARALLDAASRVTPGAAPEDVAELQSFVADLRSALGRRSLDGIRQAPRELERIVFFPGDL